MKLSADILLERMRLKKSARKWKIFGIIMLVLFFLTLSLSQNLVMSGLPSVKNANPVGKDYIARIKIEGIIMEDDYRDKVIAKLAKNKNVKAVILHINSPGGSAVGGEMLYKELKALSQKKPIAVSMGTLATSAGYMIAVAGDRIYAHKASITGSIGVIFQSPNFKGLAEKVGFDMHTIKSGDFKGEPGTLSEMPDDVRAYLKTLILDFYDVFVDIVAENREGLDKEQVIQLADGRIYSGRQAVQNGLIDAIGGEEQALIWLEKQKGIKIKEVIDISLEEPKKNLDKFFGMISTKLGLKSFIPEEAQLEGLVSIWQH